LFVEREATGSAVGFSVPIAEETTLSSENAMRRTHDVDVELIFRSHATELAELAAASASTCATDVARATELIAAALELGNKILSCGNGGSAADSQHFSAELIGKFRAPRRSLPAVSLTCDTSILTAVGNDFHFDEIFSRQIEGLGEAGDVLIGMSTSGHSRNVIRALEVAIDRGVKTVILTGRNGDAALEKADVWCRVDSESTAHIQEVHTAILHAICIGIDKVLGFEES
jgi:D-sedoheptulose 7-phosphate isomerase